ncbi:hypothetical protein EJB05_28621 [Eragrostis curvula]|uniref:Uncharacterized protein n=1 Tax=Eragrostis curvula TaxID=38414 RepID=A0A5J9UQN7_9POAL|nr:hypothetical protein EJB05_28621 [Eragrostis curvula]
MENKISAPIEGEEPNSATQVVAHVLAEKTKKSQFLQNVGIQMTRPRSNAQDLEAQLEAEKSEKNELARQVKVLSKQVEETEQGRIRDREEMKKKQADLEAKVWRFTSCGGTRLDNTRQVIAARHKGVSGCDHLC